MVISKLPAPRLSKCHRLLVVVVGLCVVAIGPYAHHTYSSSGMNPAHEAAEESLRQKYIKRLMPIDPESTEAMLAGRGPDCLDPSITLG
jgi:hypothetical protein